MPIRPSHFADDLRRVIDDLLACARGTLAALRAPYLQLAAADPTAVLGAPRPLARSALSSPLPALADIVLKLGGGAAPLLALVRADEQLDGLVRDYVANCFPMNTAASWIADLTKFEREFERLVAEAREALPRWSRLDPSASPAPAAESEMQAKILTPELAVARMGGWLQVAGLRARIRKGQEGPWRRVGNRWQIATSAFDTWQLASHEEKAAAAKRRGEAIEKLSEQHPPRRGARKPEPGGGAPPSGGKRPS